MIKTHASLVATLFLAIAPVGSPMQDQPLQPAAPPQTAAPESPLVPSPAKKPFTNFVFVSPRGEQAVLQPGVSVTQPQPGIVCGMTLMPVNPAIDRQMVVQPRTPKPNVDYKIRSLTPKVCGQ